MLKICQGADENIQRVKDALDKDCREVSEVVQLPPTTVYRIVRVENDSCSRELGAKIVD